jgi:hypothetical protein
MATTTNYGWDTPDDTDLVKDGAAAIRTLGSSIDTTTKNLNPQTTTGALAYRSATANVNTALPVGTTGQVLTVAAGVPSWATPSVGDLTEVQAGVGISVASGTGPIPVITNSSTDLITTAGDLLYGTAADTVARLGIGTVNQVLAVNSGATAPEWKTVGASGMTLVKRSTFSNVATTTTTFDGVFTSTYGSYLVIIENFEAATMADDAQLQLRAGGVTKANNYYNGSFINGSGSVSFTALNNSSTSLFQLSTDGYVFGNLFFQSSNIHGQISSQLNSVFSTINGFVDSYGPDGFLLKSSSSNISGTVAVYGLAK